MDEGHCGLPADELHLQAAALLEDSDRGRGGGPGAGLAEGGVVANTVGERACVFLAGLYRAERGIAERLLRLAGDMPPWPRY